MFGKAFSPIVKIAKKVDNTEQLVKGLESLTKQDVLIGLPQSAPSRRTSTITNAELAFIHSKGSPINNIPPRPFLEPSIEHNLQAILAGQKQILNLALKGQTAALPAGFAALGLLGQNLAKRWFTDSRNGWAPNTPATIARKGSDKPLIDTGALRQAITYVVRSNK